MNELMNEEKKTCSQILIVTDCEKKEWNVWDALCEIPRCFGHLKEKRTNNPNSHKLFDCIFAEGYVSYLKNI